jgi:hypothetical protein
MAEIETLLRLAQTEIGVRENPPGSNCVKYNTAYYGRSVCGEEYPWCCVFLWWLFREAGLSALFFGGGRTASCGALAAFARREGVFVTEGYRPGDLLFFDFGGPVIRHIGLLESIRADGALVTIEGNTGTASDDDGGAVMRRVRPPAYVAGACRPRYDEEEIMTQQQFDERMDAWLRARSQVPAAEFSAAARAWAESGGILRGDGDGNPQYESFCTREQAMVFLYRLYQLLQKEK